MNKQYLVLVLNNFLEIQTLTRADLMLILFFQNKLFQINYCLK